MIRKILTNCSSIKHFKTTSLAFATSDSRQKRSNENTQESIERMEQIETERSDEMAEDRAERAREVGQAIMQHVEQCRSTIEKKKNDHRVNSISSLSNSLS